MKPFVRRCGAWLAAVGAAAVLTTLTGLALGAAGERVVRSNGVRLSIPTAWRVLKPAPAPYISDPKPLLVVGTAGVHGKQKSECPLIAYLVPLHGAAVVVVGWNSLTDAGGHHPPPGRQPLRALKSVQSGDTQCPFPGRTATAQLWLHRHAYQLTVFVGRRASEPQIQQALAVARSFDVTR